MSRTDRHRPYWVQSAEHGTVEHHDHDLFGQAVTVRRKKRDARGRVVTTGRPVKPAGITESDIDLGDVQLG